MDKEASERKSTRQSCPTIETLTHVAAQRKVRRVKINEKDFYLVNFFFSTLVLKWTFPQILLI